MNKTMKKLLTLLLLGLCLVGTGCRSHKQSALVQVQPKFDAEVEWKLTSIRGKQVTYADDQKLATVQFNPESGVISGCAGCNRFFGNYRDLGEGHLQLSDISSTKMMCPETFMKIENLYLPTLNKVDGYELGEYQLQLFQGDKVVLTFERL